LRNFILSAFAKGGVPVQKIDRLFPFVQETTLFALSELKTRGYAAICKRAGREAPSRFINERKVNRPCGYAADPVMENLRDFCFTDNICKQFLPTELAENA
jgi:hypothetical protein